MSGNRPEEEKALHPLLSTKEAAQQSGFPDYLVESLQEKTKQGKTLISLRAGQAPNLNKGYRVSPKPMSIKTKTCTDAQGIPLLAGFVAADQRCFGREGAKLDAHPEIEHIRQKILTPPPDKSEPTKAQKEEAARIREIPLLVRRKDITEDAYEMRVENGYLYFKPKANNNDAFQDKDLDRSNIEFQILDDPDRDKLVPVKYQVLAPNQNPDPEPKELRVIAYDDFPVTGDADMFAVCVPLQEAAAIHEISEGNLHKAYNTNNPDELTDLASHYLIMKAKLENRKIQPEEVDKTILEIRENPAVKTAGIITPCQLWVMLTVDKEMEEKHEVDHPGCEFIFRHGAENYHPGEISSLDGKVLHIWNGETYITNNEKELRDFYMLPNVLESNFMHVHPRWNMDIWAPVVKKQIELGQVDLIAPEVLSSYLKHSENVKQEYFKTIFDASTPHDDTAKIYLTARKFVSCDQVSQFVDEKDTMAFIDKQLRADSAISMSTPLTVTDRIIPEGKVRMHVARYETTDPMAAKEPYASVVSVDTVKKDPTLRQETTVYAKPAQLAKLDDAKMFLMAATLIANYIECLPRDNADKSIFFNSLSPDLPPKLVVMMDYLAEKAGYKMEYGVNADLKKTVDNYPDRAGLDTLMESLKNGSGAFSEELFKVSADPHTPST